MIKKQNLVSLNTNLSRVIILSVQDSFRNLGDDIADILLSAEISIVHTTNDRATIITNFNNFADNIDKILAQTCDTVITELQQEALKIKVN